MNILVMGAGAIGSVAGGLLARAGHRVGLVGRDPHISAIRSRGLLVGGILGEYVIPPLWAYLHPREMPPQPWDLVLLATKAYDTETALGQVLPLVGGDSLVVSLQNGIENGDIIASRVGEGRTVCGRVMFGAEVVAPGRVQVTTLGGDLVLGSPTRAIPLSRLEALAGVFREAGLPASATQEIMAFLWGKLLYNCCLNPLSALLGVNYGKLGENSSTRAIIGEIIREVFVVARNQGQGLPWATPQEYEGVLLGDLIPRTAAHYASMFTDLRQGKRTEIDALNGVVRRLGGEQGVSTPTNATLTLMVKAKEGLARRAAPPVE